MTRFLRALAMAIEVEMKFVLAPDTRERLAARGAKMASSSRFTDTYYDTPSNSLMPKASQSAIFNTATNVI